MKNESIIYGKGLIANSLMKESIIAGAFFAAGVSNSSTSSERDFDREKLELTNFIQKYKTERIIYFSSFAAVCENTPYAIHKKRMEQIILQLAKEYTIIRLPQVVGITTNNTLVSYFVKSIISNNKVNIYKNAKRRLIDVNDVARIAAKISVTDMQSTIINVGPPKSVSALFIYILISRILSSNVNYQLIEGGVDHKVDLRDFEKIAGSHERIFQFDYQARTLKKYIKNIYYNQINLETLKTPEIPR